MIEIFTNKVEIEKKWQEFEKNSLESPFQTWAWNKNKSIILISIDDLILLPCELIKKNGLKILQLVCDDASDYSTVLQNRNLLTSLSKGRITEALRFACKKMPFDIFCANRTPTHWDHVQNPLLELKVVPYFEASHQLRIDKSFDDLYNTLVSAKVRNDSTRQLRRLNEDGAVKFKIATSKAEALSLLELTMEWRNKKYNAQGIPSIFNLEEYRKFYREQTENLFSNTDPQVHVSVIYLDDRPISIHWGVTHKQRFYYMIPVYETSFGKYSPGRIHLLELIRWSVANNFKIFDFTVGDEGYKKIWCNQETTLNNCYLPMTAIGYFFYWKELFKMKARKNSSLRKFVLKIKSHLR